jgi:hypothetical protein
LEGKTVKPYKPRPIRTNDGRWEIVPNVEIFKVDPLRPVTSDQRERAEKYGPLIRVLYCAATYEIAKAKVEKLVQTGVRIERIECVIAIKDTVQAVLDGNFEVIPLSD